MRGINFAVKRQECFGLLGVNGAGKTSTFQMITANSLISGGHIMIDGVDIIKSETLVKDNNTTTNMPKTDFYNFCFSFSINTDLDTVHKEIVSIAL